MRILIVTSLFPPDIAGTAPYVKELASRLKDANKVTVLAYNHIPEKIDGVQIVSIEKQDPLLWRLFGYTRALLKLARSVDIIYVQNGAPAELPAVIVSFFYPQKLFFRLGDENALCHAKESILHRSLLSLILKRSRSIVSHQNADTCTHLFIKPKAINTKVVDTDRPLVRPEILPFVPYPDAEFKLFETSWEKHLRLLQQLFTV